MAIVWCIDFREVVCKLISYVYRFDVAVDLSTI